MDQLPIELLARILENSVPPASFATFSARSSALRSLASVNRVFKEEAQRLLLQKPVFLQPQSPQGSIGEKYKGFEESLKREGRQVQELRVGWFCSDVRAARSALLQNEAVVGLRTLSLWAIPFDPNALFQLKNLHALSLAEVTFECTTPISPLSSVEELSLWYISDEMPLCLLLPQLPSLRALAHQYCGNATRFALNHILSRPSEHFRLLAIEVEDPSLMLSKEEIEHLARFTLVDMDPGEWVYAGVIEGEEEYRYIRMCAHEGLAILEASWSWWDRFWKEVMPQRCPKLEVVVIPSSWRHLSDERWRTLEEYRRSHNIKLLVEEGWDEEPESKDSQLSKAFLEYLRLKSD